MGASLGAAVRSSGDGGAESMGGDDDPSVRSLSRMCSNVTYAELHTHDCDAVQQIFDVSWWFFTQRWAAAVAFCFAALATGISLRQIAQHVSLGMHSELRAYTIRILFMVPVYSAESFLGLVFIQQAPLMRMLRQFYEAFALFSFTQFILTYLGTTDELATLLRNKQEVPHIFPFCMLEKWPMGGRFLRKVLFLSFCSCFMHFYYFDILFFSLFNPVFYVACIRFPTYFDPVHRTIMFLTKFSHS